MSRPSYLDRYVFDWEFLDVVLGGKSALDARAHLGPLNTPDAVNAFLYSYGFDQSDPVLKAELFGIFQEAIQFIKRYFLKEGHPDGLDMVVPSYLYSITEVAELFVAATGHAKDRTAQECYWAQIVLKVMHTILHADKDLRSNYFSLIQQQIFDRFYKYLSRDSENRLFLCSEVDGQKIQLKDFQTKAKKSRDSIIIKLLHKVENVAEELFDRIGVRFITQSKIDILRVIKFLHSNHIVLAHNTKPSRAQNSLIDLNKFRHRYKSLVKMSIRNNLSEERFAQALEREIQECDPHYQENSINEHTLSEYRSVQFTSRQLIRYKNPFIKDFYEVRKMAKEIKDSKNNEAPLASRILDLDISKIAREIRFFYPYELQIVDEETYKINSEGEASHLEYKKSQLKSARNRLFKDFLETTED